ncbi:hypothetical protein KXQ82_07265 [Mucilaginibacter sp. HMF5004]|uniref:hypothetical protein n=1 Tax=Mucilaginibacter rivuli TaxID=2857527 RepID=UPI001C5E96DC|nr:hypothetical protein [Mucilaginibacter rivuli]MBW4889507.1 hypothetical protein [Mucilaginibacter rivuli]
MIETRDNLMAKYLQVSFYTLMGIKTIINLGDFSYAEWIVYDNNVPKYHVNLYTENESDMTINSLINKGIESIETVISKISIKQEANLHLAKMPLIRLTKKEEYVELDLQPLPDSWLKNI